MNGWVVITLLVGVPTLTALIVYMAERNLRDLEDRARESFRRWDR